jgi:hypothetical protein
MICSLKHRRASLLAPIPPPGIAYSCMLWVMPISIFTPEDQAGTLKFLIAIIYDQPDVPY